MIVREVNHFKISVLGEVKKPGRYDFKGQATVLDAIATAGGLSRFRRALEDHDPEARERRVQADPRQLQQDRLRGGARRRPSPPRRHRPRSVAGGCRMAHDMQTASGQTGTGFTRAGEMWSRRKALGITVFAAVLAVSLGIVAALPPMFRSRATVLVDREQVPEAFVRSAVSGEVETRIHRISQEVLSRERLAGLIERFNLYPQLPRASTNEAAIEEMRRDIVLEPKVVEPRGVASPRWDSG